MSIIQSITVSLVTVATTLGGGWLVTTRITDYWDQVKKNREINLTAAKDFQRLYGDAVAIWKTWNALKGDYAVTFTTPEHARWDCLLRATAAEGEIESFLAKLSAERVLSSENIAMLGSLRQAFKSVRRAIRKDEPLPWRSDNVKEYASFKSLAAAMSVLLTSRTHAGKRPDATEAAWAFQQITANYHEQSWVDAARHFISAGNLDRRPATAT